MLNIQQSGKKQMQTEENQPMNNRDAQSIDQEEEEQEEQKQEGDQQEENIQNDGQQDRRESEKDVSLSRNINISKFICFLVIIFDIAFAEFLCMYRNVCDFSGIEIYPEFGRTVIIFLFISLFLIIVVYYCIDTLNRIWIGRFKYLLLIWGLGISIFAIFSFAYGGNVTDGRLNNAWNKLTDFSKEFYDGDSENLREIIENNLIYTGIYNIISGVLILFLFCMVIRMESIMPINWRPATKVINPGCEEKGNIILIRKKQLRIQKMKRSQKQRMEDEKLNMLRKQTDKFRNNNQNDYDENDVDENTYQIQPKGMFSTNQRRPY